MSLCTLLLRRCTLALVRHSAKTQLIQARSNFLYVASCYVGEATVAKQRCTLAVRGEKHDKPNQFDATAVGGAHLCNHSVDPVCDGRAAFQCVKYLEQRAGKVEVASEDGKVHHFHT